MFYRRKMNRNRTSLWLSAINPPFNMDEPDIIPLDFELLDCSLNNELSEDFIDESFELKTKEI